MDSHHVRIRFNNEDDYHRVWLSEQWYLEFRLDVESSIAPLWVNFSKLPAHFYAQSSFFLIARTVGVPLWMDAGTNSLTRPSMARICSEMARKN